MPSTTNITSISAWRRMRRSRSRMARSSPPLARRITKTRSPRRSARSKRWWWFAPMARPADRHSLIGAVRALAIALLLCCAIAPASRADPFTGGGSAPQASAGTTIAPWSPFHMRLGDAQARLNNAISDAFERVRDTHSHTAIALILGLAFLYGVLHALGPGHGKAVVASYFLAN